MTNNISKEEIGILVRKHPYDPSWETNKDGSKNEAVISARLEYLLSLGSEIKIKGEGERASICKKSADFIKNGLIGGFEKFSQRYGVLVPERNVKAWDWIKHLADENLLTEDMASLQVIYKSLFHPDPSEIKIIDPPVDNNNKTLRDEIAIASLTGLIMAGFDVKVIPANAYKLADLMIEKMQKDK